MDEERQREGERQRETDSGTEREMRKGECSRIDIVRVINKNPLAV